MSDFGAPSEFLDLEYTEHAVLFDGLGHVWEVLPKIEEYLRRNLRPGFEGKRLGQPYVGEDVYIGPGTVIEHGAVIKGPAWIGPECQIRAGCYIRENVIAGKGCVLGNSCEFKNCVLFEGVEAPHFNYVGDSVLGHRAHLGAGVICSNVRLDRGTVGVKVEGQRYETGLKKFGAIVGDFAEVGCNAVLSPGSLIGRRAVVFPCVHWRGYLPAGSWAVNGSEPVVKK